jgi:hypothetical protein
MASHVYVGIESIFQDNIHSEDELFAWLGRRRQIVN